MSERDMMCDEEVSCKCNLLEWSVVEGAQCARDCSEPNYAMVSYEVLLELCWVIKILDDALVGSPLL